MDRRWGRTGHDSGQGEGKARVTRPPFVRSRYLISSHVEPIVSDELDSKTPGSNQTVKQ